MTIKPIDMQVSITRAAELSRLAQTEQEEARAKEKDTVSFSLQKAKEGMSKVNKTEETKHKKVETEQKEEKSNQQNSKKRKRKNIDFTV